MYTGTVAPSDASSSPPHADRPSSTTATSAAARASRRPARGVATADHSAGWRPLAVVTAAWSGRVRWSPGYAERCIASATRRWAARRSSNPACTSSPSRTTIRPCTIVCSRRHRAAAQPRLDGIGDGPGEAGPLSDHTATSPTAPAPARRARRSGRGTPRRRASPSPAPYGPSRSRRHRGAWPAASPGGPPATATRRRPTTTRPRRARRPPRRRAGRPPGRSPTTA